MKRSRTWDRTNQCLWECAATAINGLKRCEWLTLKEHKHLIGYLQKMIENKTDSTTYIGSGTTDIM